MDSLAIATYLDETYPNTPKVLSPASRALLEEADVLSFGSGGGAAAHSELAPRLVFLILAADRLNPVSEAYYHRTRAARLGEHWTTLRDACAAGSEDRAERVRQGIDAIREVWRKVTALYDRQSDLYVLGEEPCFLDFAVAGRVKFVLDGLVPSEVETVRNLEGGRLARLVESLERYY
ncbi:hypothetical protein OG21DRAFT_1513005, partial [Imleria badia]